MKPTPRHAGAGLHVVVVGAGGNIGSHLVPHLARMDGVATLTLVDPDVYEARNVAAQDITIRDVGRPKVQVQARRARAINPSLITRPLPRPVEAIPRGKLRGDLLVTCVDSRRTRQFVNEVALHLGIPWVDAGVEPGAQLARVSAYRAGPDTPCLECAWDDRDYAAVEQHYPCQGEAHRASRTNAASFLGALAAAHQALACRSLIADTTSADGFGRQVLWDAAHHKVHVTSFRRNEGCRLAGHSPWQVWPLACSPRALSVDGLLALLPITGDAASRWLQVAGSPFVTRLACTGCGKERGLVRLQVSLRPRQLVCRFCRSPRVAPGFAVHERLIVSDLPARVLGRSLHGIGVREGEIVTVGGPHGEAHFEIRGEGV